MRFKSMLDSSSLRSFVQKLDRFWLCCLPLKVRVMFLLIISFSNIMASSPFLFAQSLNLKLEKVSLQRALDEVKKQSKYIAWYEGGKIVSDVPVTLTAKDMPVNAALEKIFANQPYTYKLVGETIVLQKKKIEEKIIVPNKAQEVVTVKGRVKLQSKGAITSFGGISVREKGGQSATTTDAEGNFSIRVRKNSILIISMLGYQTKEVPINVAEAMDIVLNEEVSSLDEVVVTGYNTQERREITGAISQIKAKDIENMPVQTFDQAMQGRMSGVNVSSASGVPGGAVKVEIRGQGSISAGTEPLYVVDGIPVNTDEIGRVASSNALSFLNPKDIASIEVLKDAAAGSIYGAQAANGVVLITTKTGAAGATVVNAEVSQGLVTPMPLIEVMNTQQFIQARIDAKRNYYPQYSYERVRSEVLTELQLPINLTDQQILNLPTYDWQSAAFRNGLRTTVNASAEGGSQRTTFRIAASYEINKGSVVTALFKRGTTSLRLNHNFNDKFSLRANVDLTMLQQDGASALGSYTNLSSPHYTAPLMLPFLSIYKPDGSLNVVEAGFPGQFRYHAIAAGVLSDNQSYTNSLFANLRGEYSFNKNLRLRSYVALKYDVNKDNLYGDPRTNEHLGRRGNLSVHQRYPTSFTTTHNLTYNKTYALHHKVTLLGGLEYRTFSRETFSIHAEGFPSYRFRTLESASTIRDATSTWTGVNRMGIFGQANYNFKNKYMFSGILRYDGSSRFGENNMFGLFPAVSVGWDVAQEKFMKSVSWLDQMKFRAGYGETGNDRVGNFEARALYSTDHYDGQGGTVPAKLANDNLKWERNSTTNIGLDYSILNRRVYGSFEVYRRLSKDLLLSQPVPWVSGYSDIFRNVGEVKNEGIEFEVSVLPIKTPKLSWTSSFNISFLRNEVTKLYGDLSVLPGDASVRVGYSLQTNFVNQYAGVNSATGRPMWYDRNGDYSYYPPGQNDESYTLNGRGNRMSDYYGGWGNNFRYKSFNLDILLQYDYGREMYNNMGRIMSRKGDLLVNGSVWYYENRWTTPGDITSVPRSIEGSTEVSSISADGLSTRFLEDASYIRLKHINLSYNLPSSFVRKLKVSDIRLFFQALNLYTWTKWTGYDPEFYVDNSHFTSNAAIVPPTKTYNIGLQVKF